LQGFENPNGGGKIASDGTHFTGGAGAAVDDGDMERGLAVGSWIVHFSIPLREKLNHPDAKIAKEEKNRYKKFFFSIFLSFLAALTPWRFENLFIELVR
jgi:hypothetical protein